MKTRTRAPNDTPRDTNTYRQAKRKRERADRGPRCELHVLICDYILSVIEFCNHSVYLLFLSGTLCDTNISLAAVSMNLNIPANHRVQSSAVITANALVSLRKQ